MALAEERAAEERMIQGNGLCAGLSQMARERKRNNLKWSPHVMYARPSILHYECTRVQHTPGTSDYDDDDDDAAAASVPFFFSGVRSEAPFCIKSPLRV